MALVSREEYQSWLGDPVTREVRKKLRIRLEEAKEDWANGNWRNDPQGDAYARGYVNALMQFEMMDDEFEQGGE